MGNFTITQTPKPKNTYLYPNGNGCHHDCIPHGAMPGWRCVKDEYNSLTPEEEYVFMTDLPIKHDAYIIDDPGGSLAGIINYIKLVCNAKSDEYPPAWNAVFKLFIAESVAGHTTLTLRPTGDGVYTQWIKNTTFWWEAVDDVVQDGDTTHIREATDGDKCYFTLSNHTTETGTITDVTVYGYFARGAADIGLIVYDTVSSNRVLQSISVPVGATYVERSYSFPTNPNGGSWTWTDIDNLQIGLQKLSGTLPYCTQLYVVITYESGTACNQISKSDNQQLSTGWNKFSYNMINNPTTSNPWTWGELADLQIGFEASSPDVIVTPFVLLPTGDGDRTDIYKATSGYEHWECVVEEYPESQVYEYGATWAYDLYEFIQASSTYYPAGNWDYWVKPFTYNEKEYVLLCSYSLGIWIYEWTGDHFIYITKSDMTQYATCAVYDGTYFYIGGDGATDTSVRAYTFDGKNFTQVGYHDALTNSPYSIALNGEIENNDGYIYYVGSDNILRVISFDGNTFTTHASSGGAGWRVYGDGTYLHSGKRAWSFDGTTLTNICGGGNDCIFDGDGTYLYATDDVGFNSYIVAYTFNGTAYTEVSRKNVGSTAMALTISCSHPTFDGYIYLSLNGAPHGIQAYTFDGTTFTYKGASTSVNRKTHHTSNGKYLFNVERNSTNISVHADTFDGENFHNLGKVEDGSLPGYLDGNIESVTVVAKMGKEYDAPDEADIRGCFIIKTHSTEYNTSSDYVKLEYPQRLYSYTWAINPNTSSAWTLDEVKALQAGIGLYGNGTKYAACSRCYIVLSTTTSVSPQIQVCQEYAKVNYQAEDVVCTLPKPQKTSRDHDRNVKMINFWSGKRVVYDLSRSGKNMVMTGKIFDQDCGTLACDAIKCVEALAEEGTPVTINGLNFSLFNGEFRILSFGYKHISEKPEAWEWILELEDNTI